MPLVLTKDGWNKKPSGPVEIDWSKLPNNLTHLFAIDEKGGNTLRSKKGAGADAQVSTTPQWEQRGVYVNGSATAWVLPGSSASDVSVLVSFVPQSVLASGGGTNHALWISTDASDGANNLFLRYDFTNSKLQLLKSQVALIEEASYTFALGKEETAIVTYSDPDYAVYIAGRKILSGTYAGALLTAVHRIGAEGTTGGQNQGEDVYRLWLESDTIWPEAICKELTKNPYQILKPKTSYFFVPEAAVGGFQPAWARNSNQIIGVSQ